MIKTRKCAECGRRFVPKREHQLYCNLNGEHTCKNRAAARRLRERARKYDELNAEMHGGIGARA